MFKAAADTESFKGCGKACPSYSTAPKTPYLPDQQKKTWAQQKMELLLNLKIKKRYFEMKESY